MCIPRRQYYVMLYLSNKTFKYNTLIMYVRTLHSALAQLSMNTSSYLPKDFVKSEYVNLVYDNIDFGEKIAKQTHVTNGIITQKVIVVIIITTLVHIYKSAILSLHFGLQNLKNILHILFR